MKYLFAKFLARYGAKWSSQYSPELMPAVHAEWLDVLKHFTLDEIKHGLDNWKQHWPPNQFEFADVCRPVKIPGIAFHDEYIGEHKALPAPKNKSLAAASINEMKKILR